MSMKGIMTDLENGRQFENIRILILEDNPADAEFLIDELKENGFVFDFKLLDTRKAYIEAVRNYHPDIILSDYDLPGFSGQEALQIKKEMAPETPFILVSGVVTEERAIEILTGGATDYVLKKNLSRISPAVRRVLDESYEHRKRKEAEAERDELLKKMELKIEERTAMLQAEIAERKKTEEKLRESSQRYKELVNNANSIIIRMDQKGSITFFNEYAQSFFGYSLDEIMGQDVRILVPQTESNGKNLEKMVNDLLRNPDEFIENVNENVRKNGERIWILWKNKAIRDEFGNIAGNLAVGTDITERKRAEEQLQLSKETLAGTLRASATAMVLTRPEDGCILDMNDRWLELMEYTREEAIGKTAAEHGGWKDLNVRAAIVRKLQEHGFVRDVECVMRARSGRERTVMFSGQVVTIRGERVLVSSVVDITERKKTEEALEKSERNLRALIMASSEVIYRMSPDWSEMHRLYGQGFLADTEEPNRNWIEEYIPPEAKEEVVEAINKAIRSKSVFELEHQVLRADGTLGWTFSRAIPILDDSGEIVEWFGAASDITERKLYQENEERLLTLLNHIPSLVFLKDEEGRYVYLNETYEEQFIHSKDWLGKTDYDFWPRESADLFRTNDADVLRMGTTRQFTEDSTDLEGTRYCWLCYKFPFIDSRNRRYLGGVGINVTRRILAEEALAKANDQTELDRQRLQTILETSPSAVVVVDAPDGRLSFMNKRALALYGADYIGIDLAASVAKIRASSPDGSVCEVDELPASRALWMGEVIRNEEWIIHRADGVPMPVLVSAAPIRNAKGEIVSAVVMFEDITGRKHVQEKLRESEARFRTLTETSPLAVGVSSFEGRFLYLNKAYEKMFGYTLEELNRLPASELWRNPEDRSKMIDAVRKTGILQEYEAELKRKDGTPFWTSITLNLVDYGGVQAVMATVFDITDRKIADEAVRKSNDQFSVLLENIKAGVALIDTSGKFTVVNLPFLKMFGLRENETIKNVNDKNWSDWQVFDENGMLLPVDEHPVRKAVITGKAVRNKLVGVRLPSGGSLIWMLISADVLKFDNQVQSVICTYHDITDLKHAEDALKESEEKYRNLFMNMTEEVHFWKLERDENGAIKTWRIVDVNPPAVRTWERKSREDTIGRMADEIYPGATAHYMPIVQKIMTEGVPYSTEDYFPPPVDKYFRFTSIPLGEYFITTGADVTDIKKAQKLVEQRNVQLENANKELEAFTYFVSHDLRAPLRAIDGYSRMILRKQGDQFDEETRQKFDLIQSSTKAMGQLIDDLLTLSRFDHQVLNLSTLDMRELLEATWRELQSMEPGQRITLKMKDMPQCIGDRGLIRQIWVNLLSNAVKFTRSREEPAIEAGGRKTEKDVIYYLKDNGVGFDMAYSDKIFDAFKRLHSSSEYEGTGIGLAIVARIIHRHGGKVWAEGKVDQGAIVYFSFPII